MPFALTKNKGAASSKREIINVSWSKGAGLPDTQLSVTPDAFVHRVICHFYCFYCGEKKEALFFCTFITDESFYKNV